MKLTNKIKKATLLAMTVATVATPLSAMSMSTSVGTMLPTPSSIASTDSDCCQLPVVTFEKTGGYTLPNSTKAKLNGSTLNRPTCLHPTITGMEKPIVVGRGSYFSLYTGDVKGTDNMGRNLTVSVAGTTSTRTTGVFTITYTVTDEAGRVTTATRDLVVL